MKKLLLASAVAFGAAMSSPAAADIVQVDTSTIQGYNVLFNNGDQSGNVVNGWLNNAANTAVVFTGSGGAILRAQGGQSRITGDLDLSTGDPNDTLLLNGLDFGLEGGGLFNNVEFNLFGGTATSANFVVTDDSGQLFNFVGALTNGANLFGFQAINGQSIRNISFSTVGGGVEDVRLIRLGLTDAAVPEPASWAMLIAGFGMVGAASRRRQRSTAVTAA